MQARNRNAAIIAIIFDKVVLIAKKTAHKTY